MKHTVTFLHPDGTERIFPKVDAFMSYKGHYWIRVGAQVITHPRAGVKVLIET